MKKTLTKDDVVLALVAQAEKNAKMGDMEALSEDLFALRWCVENAQDLALD